MKIISLGGVGGCELAKALRNLNQETYPYDWLITAQSFIIKSFNNINNFFVFDDYNVYDTHKLLDVNKKAIMLHDFHNFHIEKDIVIQKYKRRFERLNTVLRSNDSILFVRIYDNLEDKLVPLNYYDNIFTRDDENMIKWNDFIIDIQNTFNNNKIKLLVITNKQNLCTVSENVILHYTNNHTDNQYIYNIIKTYI